MSVPATCALAHAGPRATLSRPPAAAGRSRQRATAATIAGHVQAPDRLDVRHRHLGRGRRCRHYRLVRGRPARYRCGFAAHPPPSSHRPRRQWHRTRDLWRLLRPSRQCRRPATGSAACRPRHRRPPLLRPFRRRYPRPGLALFSRTSAPGPLSRAAAPSPSKPRKTCS